MSIKNRAGACGCCGGICDIIIATSENVTDHFTVDGVYEWDGILTTDQVAVSILPMPSDHYKVIVEIAAISESDISDVSIQTQHFTLRRVPLVAPVEHPADAANGDYRSELQLSGSTTLEWLSDLSITPPAEDSVILTAMTSEGFVWSVEEYAVVDIVGDVHVVNSPTIQSNPFYGYDDLQLRITNHGTASVSIVSVTVQRIRSLIDSSDERTLSFIPSETDDPVENPRCEDEFPECWDTELELSDPAITIVPGEAHNDGVKYIKGCLSTLTWKTIYPDGKILPNYGSVTSSISEIGSGSYSGWSWTAYERALDDTGFIDQTLTPKSAHQLFVECTVQRLDVPVFDDPEDPESAFHYPWKVSIILTGIFPAWRRRIRRLDGFDTIATYNPRTINDIVNPSGNIIDDFTPNDDQLWWEPFGGNTSEALFEETYATKPTTVVAAIGLGEVEDTIGRHRVLLPRDRRIYFTDGVDTHCWLYSEVPGGFATLTEYAEAIIDGSSLYTREPDYPLPDKKHEILTRADDPEEKIFTVTVVF